MLRWLGVMQVEGASYIAECAWAPHWRAGMSVKRKHWRKTVTANSRWNWKEEGGCRYDVGHVALSFAQLTASVTSSDGIAQFEISLPPRL